MLKYLSKLVHLFQLKGSHCSSVSHLFEERHGELLVGDAVSGGANVFLGLVGDVEVNPHQDVFLQRRRCEVKNYFPLQNVRTAEINVVSSLWSYKALCSVVHDAELEPLLVLEGFGECTAKGI